MSHDGSSAKSYIRHTTEKERLDNLAFASFPEDYLPYASAQGHNRAVPPPYLLWGEDRRRRPTKRRRNPKCAGALLCAIILVVIAILAVVAISVYLGVVTNLFRSPVVSLSGRFLASEEFSEELRNATSSQFLEKADIYQSKIEKAFLSSSIEPAFIAARIYSFRPGLEIFFRVYLDRRKLTEDDGDTSPNKLVRDLVAKKLAQDPNSVFVEENENLLVGEYGFTESMSIHTTNQFRTTTQEPNQPHLPSSGGVGEWHPVPIEDSVSPSFGDGPPQSRVGSERSPDLSKKLTITTRTAQVVDKPQKAPQPPESPVISSNAQQNILTSPNPLRTSEVGVGSVRLTGSRNPLLKATHQEGTGSVHLLENISTKKPKLGSNRMEGIGSVRLLDDVPIVPENEGIGSIRLLDESPKKHIPFPDVFIKGEGSSKLSEDLGRNLPSHSYPLDKIHTMETPPTLFPSVMLVVRNRSRSDKFQKAFSKEKPQQESGLRKTENIGIASVHEVMTETDNFPWQPHIESDEKVSLMLHSKSDQNMESALEANLMKENETNRNLSMEFQSTVNSSLPETTTLNDLVFSEKETDLELLKHEQNFSQNNSHEIEITTVGHTTSNFSAQTPDNPTEKTLPKTTLENILFSHLLNQSSVIYEDNNSNTETNMPIQMSSVSSNIKLKIPEDVVIQTSTSATSSANEIEIHISESTSTANNSNNSDIYSSIANHSQYPTPETHFHALGKDTNASSVSFEDHTSVGHGFHKLLITQPPTDTSLLLENVTPPDVKLLTSNQSVPESNISTAESMTEKTSSEHMYTNLETFEFQLMNESKLDKHILEAENTDISTTTTVKPGGSEESEVDLHNVTTEDSSQQAKVVPQLQSHLLSNNIDGEEESTDGFDENFQEEILQHITTVVPQQNGTGNQSCLFGMVPCINSGEGCGVRCDMKKDCSNNEDEQGCVCSDFLRAMGQSQKVCDGVDDCSDGSDESDCSWCPSSDHFRCPGSHTCITLDRVCDSKEDCPGAQDEKHCVSLADSSMEAKSLEYRPKGYLLLRRNGRWGKLCLDSLAQSPDLDRRTQELGRAVCTALTYRNMSSSVRTVDHIEVENSYYQISTQSATNRSVSSLFESSSCKRREVLSVQCDSLECGLRPSATPTQRRRIVGGKSAEGAGAWPWAVALYREGDFQCGAALISEHWLVSAAHCFYSSQGAYWVARLGVLRRGSELPSGWEQVRPIQDIILHPDYEDVGFINDIALLRMEKPVPFSDFLRPICLPSSAAEDASLWHGRRCAVTGWGKLYEIGHTFPDSLQEVFLPVISSAECQRRSMFLPAYRITPKMFCAGYERGGRDACLGDSGGPMACQRPSDSRWVLLGVTSNGDGCGRPNRPGVYTQVAGYLSWLHEVTLNQKEFARRTGSESTCPGGVRCRLGRCIQQARVCDGKRDCAAGEDEEHC